jgi:predicted MFS family arabinose efflux permease
MSTGFNLARAVGPAAGAWMLVNVGPAAAFSTNAASYLVIGALLWQLAPQPPSAVAVERPSPLSDPTLVRLFGLVFLFGLCAMPSLSLLAVVARDAIHGEAAQYGHLLSAFGIGAVSAGLAVASVARRVGEKWMIAGTSLVASAGFALLAGADVEWEAVCGAAVCGAGWIGTISTINAAVQMRAPAEARARSLAFYLTFAVGGQALGSLLGGWLAATLGLAPALGVCGGALVLYALLVLAVG